MYRLNEKYLKSVIKWRELLFDVQYILSGEKEFDLESFNEAMQYTYIVFNEIKNREDFSLPIKTECSLVPKTITISEYTNLIRLISEYATDFYGYKNGPIEFRASQIAASTLLCEVIKGFSFSDNEILRDALVFENEEYKYSCDITSGDLSGIIEALKEYRRNFE